MILSTVADVREGFICPQCHQDMSTMEMLQAHFQDVHMKQPSSTVKGFFSLAREKIKSVQDNLTVSSNEQSNSYAQYFSFTPNVDNSNQQSNGYLRSFTDQFNSKRKERSDQISIDTAKLLLRLEQLISSESQVPKNGNTKERRKYEQSIVEWIDESKVSLCPSCAKPFGFRKRKHHCRLDGFVICNQCSQFLPYSMARYLIDPNSNRNQSVNGLTLQRSNSLTSLNSSAGFDESLVNSRDNGTHQDYVRICLSCQQVLQRRYDHLSFKNLEKEDIFLHYDKIVQAREEIAQIHPKYSRIVESLLSGDTAHQITDAQQLYRRLSSFYERIDTTSKIIARLGENCENIDENDTVSQIRYNAVCRNIRMYAIHLLQNYSISTRRVPTEEDVQRAREERKRFIEERNESERLARAELASKIPSNNTSQSPTTKKANAGWTPKVDRSVLGSSEELEPLMQQIYQVTQFIRQAQMAGREDEVKLLQSNLRELEKCLREC